MHCRKLTERLTKHTKKMAYYSSKKIANYRDGKHKEGQQHNGYLAGEE